MSDIFKDGSVPFPDYDRDDTANFTQKAEFIELHFDLNIDLLHNPDNNCYNLNPM